MAGSTGATLRLRPSYSSFAPTLFWWSYSPLAPGKGIGGVQGRGRGEGASRLGARVQEAVSPCRRGPRGLRRANNDGQQDSAKSTTSASGFGSEFPRECVGGVPGGCVPRWQAGCGGRLPGARPAKKINHASAFKQWSVAEVDWWWCAVRRQPRVRLDA